MATQVQLRRGTEAEQDLFTGAEGELTYSTDSKGLRIHDGTTMGGFPVDVVVAWQKPTAENNYTWYRKYASGWVEQGGWAQGASQDFTVTLAVPMADNRYVVSGLPDNNTGVAGSTLMIDSNSATENGFRLVVNFIGTAPSTKTVRWRVEGMAATTGLTI